MYSDMSMRTSAVSSSKRYSARAFVSSVLPTPVGPKNMNEPIGRCGSCRPARAAHGSRNRAHRLRLTNDTLAEHLLHAQQLVLLAFQHLVDRHAGPARHHLRDAVGGHRRVNGRCALAGFHSCELLLKIGDAAVSQFARTLVFALALGIGEFGARLFEFALQLLRVGELALLRLPA